MRICYTSDFHGSRTHYSQLGEILRAERPALAILGGDMLPDGNEPDPPGDQAVWVSSELKTIIENYTRILPRLVVAVCMGNHDWTSSEIAIRELERIGILRLLDTERVWNFGGVNFLGCSLAPPSPHFVKDYERLDVDGAQLPGFDCEVLVSENGRVRRSSDEEHFLGMPSMAAVLDRIASPPDPWILVAHAPPYDTKLDRLPGIPYPIGSKAVRRFIEMRRPMCSLHGHVHESPEIAGGYFDELNGVLCINPGQSHQRIQAVVFDTDDVRGTLRHTVFQ